MVPPGSDAESQSEDGVDLPVEMCEESEVSELSPLERSGVAQKRLRFVFFEFLWRGERLGKVTK
jgi:hypothetical protein